MSSLVICLAAQDPPDGPVVFLSREGTGKVHLANEDRGMTSGWLRPPVDWTHSELCSRCLEVKK